MTIRPVVFVILCAVCVFGCRRGAEDGGPPEAAATIPIDETLAAWVDAAGDRALLTAIVQPEAAGTLLAAVRGRIEAVAPDLARELPDPMKGLEALIGELPEWDRTRPIVGAFFEPAFAVPAGALAPQLPDPLDLQQPRPPMRHRLLIPARDPAKLVEGIQATLQARGWRMLDGTWTPGAPTSLRLFAEADRVRLELATEGSPPTDWSVPGGPSARTPAHAALVAADGPPARVLVRPWHLRAVHAQRGAYMVAAALAAASSEVAPMLASHGMAEVMAAEVMMHGQGAEFDDWLFTLGGDAKALDLRVMATLTAAGRVILERRGRLQPLVAGEGAVVQASMAVDLRAMLDAAAVPEGYGGEGAFSLTRGLNVCGIGCPLHALARRPFGLLKAMTGAAARKMPIAAGEFRAPQVAFFGMQGSLPRIAAAWQVPAGADLGPVRAAIAEARAPGLEMWTRPLDGGAQAVIVGMGTTPDAAFAALATDAPFAGLTASPSAMSGAPPAVKLVLGLITGLDGRLDVAGGAMVGQLRLGLDGPPKALITAPAQPVFGEGPIRVGGQGPAVDCLRRATRKVSEAYQALASVSPSMRGGLADRALGDVEADLTCVEGDETLAPAARSIRRMLLLPASSAELKGWSPAGAIARLTPLCEAGDAQVCARLKAVEGRPNPALPTWTSATPSVDNCPTPIERGTAVRMTASGLWLGDRALPEGADISAAFKGAPKPLQLGVDTALPWSRVKPIIRALTAADVPEVVLVGEREGKPLAVPVQLRLPKTGPAPNPTRRFAARKSVPHGVPVTLAADGARIGGGRVTREALRIRRIESPDAVFDVYPADDVPWRAIADQALSVCGAAVLSHLAPPPAALLHDRLGQGTLDGALLGRLGGGLGGRPDARVGGDTVGKEMIRRVIAVHKNRVRYCYEKALRLAPELAGKVTGRFVIQPDGGVGEVEVTGDLDDAEVKRCVGKVLGRMRFPEAKKPTRVSYPFKFEPG